MGARLACARVLPSCAGLGTASPQPAVEIAQCVPCEQPGALHRSVADTLVSEVLPLAEACRFLEREARWILAPQRLSTHARPFWLRRVTAETRREPLGVVLIIAPANYPLFLPGVQALQALAAGNAVLWKPAAGGMAAAEALRDVLVGCGLDPALLQLLDESPQAAADAIAAGVDKVFLTGSAATGTAVLSQLAAHRTPAVMELSGCDAVFVLPGAARTVRSPHWLSDCGSTVPPPAWRRAVFSWWANTLAWCRPCWIVLKSLPAVALPAAHAGSAC